MKILTHIAYIIFAAVCCIPHLQAQTGNSSVTVYAKSNDSKDAIRLKWFYTYLIDDKGWDIYRKSNETGSDWIKLNTSPIAPGNPIYKERLRNDTLLYNLATIAEDKWVEAEGMHLLLYIKYCVVNDDFAQTLGIRFDDKTVKPNVTYTYKIQSAQNSNINGLSSDVSLNTAASIADMDGSRIVYHNDEEVTFAWDPEIMEYFGVDVFRKSKNNGVFSKINNVPVVVSQHEDENGILRYSDVFYRDTTVVTHKTYTYQLRPLDVFGEYGEPSENLEVVVGSKSAPPPPLVTDYELIDGFARVFWKTPDADDIAEYVIERSENPNNKFKEIGRSPAHQPYFQDDFEGHGMYYYRVKTIDTYGNASKYIRVPVELKDSSPPPSPSNFSVVRDKNKFTLTWDPVTDRQLWGYRVFISHLDQPTDHQFAPIDDSLIIDNSFSFTLNDSIESAYIFAVGAYDIAHNRSPLSRSDQFIFDDVIKPTPGTLRDIDHANGAIILNWHPSRHDDVTHYHLLRRVHTPNKKWQYVKEIPASTDDFTFKESVPTWRVDIDYAIVATDDAGWHSDTSNILTINPHKENATDIDVPRKEAIKLVYIDTQKAVRVKWNKNGLDNLKGFVVFRKKNGGRFLPQTSLIQGTQWIDQNVETSDELEYQIRYYHTNHDFGVFENNTIKIPNN